MAATYSPTMQRSTIGDAVCVGGSAASLPRALPRPCALRAALPRPSAALAPLPRLPLCARLRLYPARLCGISDYSHTILPPPRLLKSMVSLNLRCSLSFTSMSIYRAFLIRCASHGCLYSTWSPRIACIVLVSFYLVLFTLLYGLVPTWSFLLMVYYTRPQRASTQSANILRG